MNKSTRSLSVVLALAFLGLTAVSLIAYFAVPKVLVMVTKASPVGKVALQNSYVLGAKMSAKADGIDKAKINVFVLDKEGKGVPSQRVDLNGGGSVIAVNDVTDKNGQAVFEISSTVEGQYEMTATVNGAPLGKTVTVTFRN